MGTLYEYLTLLFTRAGIFWFWIFTHIGYRKSNESEENGMTGFLACTSEEEKKTALTHFMLSAGMILAGIVYCVVNFA